MIISADTGEMWTFRDMDEYSNRVANFFYYGVPCGGHPHGSAGGGGGGFHRGDVVALFMENKPKYVAFVIGLAKIGVTAALINCNLTQEV